jgi:hypothetical protein
MTSHIGLTHAIISSTIGSSVDYGSSTNGDSSADYGSPGILCDIGTGEESSSIWGSPVQGTPLSGGEAYQSPRADSYREGYGRGCVSEFDPLLDATSPTVSGYVSPTVSAEVSPCISSSSLHLSDIVETISPTVSASLANLLVDISPCFTEDCMCVSGLHHSLLCTDPNNNTAENYCENMTPVHKRRRLDDSDTESEDGSIGNDDCDKAIGDTTEDETDDETDDNRFMGGFKPRVIQPPQLNHPRRVRIIQLDPNEKELVDDSEYSDDDDSDDSSDGDDIFIVMARPNAPFDPSITQLHIVDTGNPAPYYPPSSSFQSSVATPPRVIQPPCVIQTPRVIQPPSRIRVRQTEECEDDRSPWSTHPDWIGLTPLCKSMISSHKQVSLTPSTATPSVASHSVATPSVASPSVASPSVATPSVATPSVASPSVAVSSVTSPSASAIAEQLDSTDDLALSHPELSEYF